MIKQLGLLNSWWSLILPVMVTGFSVIVLRSFMMGLPQDILESARIDGANDLQIFWRIILPLSKAALAVIGVFFAVGFWNSWFNALLYINDPSKLPLPWCFARTLSTTRASAPSSSPPGPASCRLPSRCRWQS
jgi:multiple sugar transport system permease protein/putative aldouronate transport system permease protein